MTETETETTTAATQPRILVVDDEPSARSALTELLREEGYQVRSAGDGYKALGQLENWTPDLVITDVKMPGMDGIELMRKIRDRFEAVGVVVMTAFGSVENAVEAMHKGADDYLTKPVHFPELLVVVKRVLDHYALRRENDDLRSRLEDDGDADPGELEWIGASKPSRELIGLVKQVADSDASVLILGESGTGKELVARALHEWGNRKDGPFVSLHCAALAEGVLESELFGHEKGAFTGAGATREGRFKKADGGTLFLDEIGDIPPATQVKLLRFLQERKFERVGSDETIAVDVRVVAATHRDLYKDVQEGRFREDLYYRLNVITLRVPTLRQRREDLPALAMHFLQKYARKNRKFIRGFNDRALRVLLNYDWPGNIRQLENTVERAVVLCQGREIEPKHLPREIMGATRPTDEIPQVPGTSMAELEKFAILKTLEHVRGSTSKAAEILGISPRKIQYRLAEYRDSDPSGIPAVVATGSARDSEGN
jgi:DNA-binding NtrC family response regulator